MVTYLKKCRGIQRAVKLADGLTPNWETISSEIEINLHAPIHLSLLFMPHLKTVQNPTIMTVTSGLSFVPYAKCPIYAPTKAALHSFTWALRHQLKEIGISVVEIIPPAVDTDLQAPGLHKFGMNVDVFADEVYGKLKAGEEEVAAGFAEMGRVAYRKQNEAIFENLNKGH
jgi:uncharacterized oxidoreductase